MLDAYAIKKIAPRILIAVVLINLSIYLVAAAVEGTRIIARGAGGIITSPFTSSGSNNFDLGDTMSLQQGALLGVGGYFTYKAVSREPSVVSNMFKNLFNPRTGTRAGEVTSSLHMFLFMVAVPVGLIALAVMVTLIFRQGLIILLAMVSPIAFALYILPGTEKYFKKWWELFSKTLLMYPIIMAIFAISDILTSIIFKNNEGSISGLIAGLIAMFAPLALIPFSFKFAGGALSSIYGVLSSGGNKLRETSGYKRQKELAKWNWQSKRTQAKADAFRQAVDTVKNDRSSRFAKSMARTRMRSIGMDVFRREGEFNEIAAKQAQHEREFGDDTRLRAATAIRTGETKRVTNSDGTVTEVPIYRSLGGKEFSEEEVMMARRSVGNNQYVMQQAVAHELGKALTEDDWVHLENGFVELSEQMGWSTQTASSVYVGAGFMTKPKSLITKHTTLKDRPDGTRQATLNTRGKVQEQHSTAGTYQAVARAAEDHRMDGMIYAELLAKEQQLLEKSQLGTITPEEETRLTQISSQKEQIEQIAKGHIQYLSAGGSIKDALDQANIGSTESVAPSAAPEVQKAIEELALITGQSAKGKSTDPEHVDARNEAIARARAARTERNGLRFDFDD